MLTDTNITWGFVLLSPFIIPILILLTFWFFVSKRKFNFLIAFTILSLLFVRYLRFPYDTVNRNSELEVSQNFLIKRTLSSDSEHEVYKLIDKTGDLDENISLNSELSKKLETKYKKDRAFYLMFWSVMLLMEIIYLFMKNRKNHEK